MYTRYFWQGSHHTYGHIRCVCTALANPTHESTAADHPSNNCTRAPASVQCHRPAVSDLTANVTRKHSCLQRHKHSCLQRHTQALLLTTSQALLLTTSQALLLTTSQALLLSTSHASTLAYNIRPCFTHRTLLTPRGVQLLMTALLPYCALKAPLRSCVTGTQTGCVCLCVHVRHWYANRMCACVCVCLCVTSTQTGCVCVFMCACALVWRRGWGRMKSRFNHDCIQKAEPEEQVSTQLLCMLAPLWV